jgi:hypothetical protein
MWSGCRCQHSPPGSAREPSAASPTRPAATHPPPGPAKTRNTQTPRSSAHRDGTGDLLSTNRRKAGGLPDAHSGRCRRRSERVKSGNARLADPLRMDIRGRTAARAAGGPMRRPVRRPRGSSGPRAPASLCTAIGVSCARGACTRSPSPRRPMPRQTPAPRTLSRPWARRICCSAPKTGPSKLMPAVDENAQRANRRHQRHLPPQLARRNIAPEPVRAGSDHRQAHGALLWAGMAPAEEASAPPASRSCRAE